MLKTIIDAKERRILEYNKLNERRDLNSKIRGIVKGKYGSWPPLGQMVEF